ncbi:MAG TPA: glycosyltransferase [Solirubrobacteraceae bacterium]|nr:glycosyltransferase [Solirubrobacteraceae bacterium]
MVVVDARAHRAHPTAIPLRFGLHPAFVPRPNVRRQDHVLYAGRLTRDKGVGELLHAAARATEPWQLKFVGGGPLAQQLRRVAERLGIAERVRWSIPSSASASAWLAGIQARGSSSCPARARRSDSSDSRRPPAAPLS